MPFDVFADFMPLLGFADDAAVLYAAIRAVAPHIKPEHRVHAKEALDRVLPKLGRLAQSAAKQ